MSIRTPDSTIGLKHFSISTTEPHPKNGEVKITVLMQARSVVVPKIYASKVLYRMIKNSIEELEKLLPKLEEPPAPEGTKLPDNVIPVKFRS